MIGRASRASGAGRFPLAGTLGPVAPHAGEALVSPAARGRLMQVAGRIPAALTRAAYLECRLRGDAEPVDLILRVERDGAEILAGRNPRVDAGPYLRDAGPAWKAAAGICRAWTDAREPAWALVRHLWLEMDLDAASLPGAPPVPAPSVFVALDPERTVGMDADALAAAACTLLDPLLPGGVDAASRARLGVLLRARPLGAAVPYLGCMLSRARPALRLYLSRVAADQVPRVLLRAGWAEDGAAQVAGTTDALRTEPGPVLGMLHLDVLEGALLPRLGMEYTLERAPQLRGQVAERAFLDRLVDRGLCAPARRDALLAWPGCEVRTLRHELWPSWLIRRVNCVKLVHEPGRDAQAKAYLLAYHQPRARAGATA